MPTQQTQEKYYCNICKKELKQFVDYCDRLRVKECPDCSNKRRYRKQDPVKVYHVFKNKELIHVIHRKGFPTNARFLWKEIFDMKKITVWFIILLVLVIAGYDTFAFIRGGYQSTISDIIINASFAHPVIPAFLGGLLAHLVWPGTTLWAQWIRTVIGGVLLVVLVAVGFIFTLHILPLYSAFIGFLLGRFLFPQQVA